MIIESRAPTRIDLAGGTVDLWPLYLFLHRPLTVNLGIDLWAQARIEEVISGRPSVRLRADDQKAELKMAWEEILTDSSQTPSSVPPQLELHYKLLRHFARARTSAPTGTLTLSTSAKSPAGAGLGGSSTLSVAMVGALATWARGGEAIDPLTEGEHWIEVVRDIETTVIRVPAGVQDYYGAMYGGLQALRWGVANHKREWLPEAGLKELEKRLLLFYSGQSRNSGINNWSLYKSFIDGDSAVRARFDQIAFATSALELAIVKRNWKEAGQSIRAEWEARRGLAAGITTPEIDRAFELAHSLGAKSGVEVAGKICGAGGGGCFFIYLSEADDDLKKQIRQAIENLGVRHLPFRAVSRGLEIKVSRA